MTERDKFIRDFEELNITATFGKGLKARLPFVGPLLESTEAATATDAGGETTASTPAPGAHAPDYLDIDVPEGQVYFTMPMLVKDDGYTMKLRVALAGQEDRYITAGTSLKFYRSLLESCSNIAVGANMHVPRRWSDQARWQYDITLSDFTLHHTKLHVPWLQSFIIGLSGQPLECAAADFVPVFYDIRLKMCDYNILWPTNRYNMMVDMSVMVTESESKTTSPSHTVSHLVSRWAGGSCWF